jgi:hypothetical protein
MSAIILAAYLSLIVSLEPRQTIEVLTKFDWNIALPTNVSTPAIVSFSPNSNIVGDGFTNRNRLTLDGTAAANSLVNLFDGVTLLGTVPTNSVGAWSVATSTLADGTHAFTETDTVAGVTSSASSTFNLMVDIHAPNAPTPQPISSDQIAPFSPAIGWITDGDNAIGVSNASSLTLTGTAEANSVVNIFDGNTELGTTIADNWGSWSYSTGPLTAGSHSFWETDNDPAGNTSQASTNLNVLVNSTVTLTTDQGKYHNSDWTYIVTNNAMARALL